MGTGHIEWIPWRTDWVGLYSTLYISVVIFGRRAGRVIPIGERASGYSKNTMAGTSHHADFRSFHVPNACSTSPRPRNHQTARGLISATVADT